MTLQEAIDKATKLIRLSESSNPHEAALAAQRAQEILTRYSIDRAVLNESGPKESIERTALDTANQRITRWKATLGSRIAKANACRVFQSGNVIGIIGHPSDIQKVRYLYDLLVRDVDRLTNREGKGLGKNWCTQFRYGVVDTIADKLASAKQKVVNELRVENTGMALARINQAIAKLEENEQAVDTWVAQNMKFKTAKTYVRMNDDARQAGRVAGREINISGARGAIE